LFFSDGKFLAITLLSLFSQSKRVATIFFLKLLKGLMIYFSFPHFGWEQYDIGVQAEPKCCSKALTPF
jgi:hypothetical protein